MRSAGRSSRAPSSSPAMPPDGRRRGGHRNRTKHTGGPPSRVLRGGLLVERQRREPEVDRGRPQARFLAEDDAAGADAELGEVDPEDVGVLVVVGVQEKALVQRGDWAQGSNHERPRRTKTSAPTRNHRCTSRSEPQNEYQPHRSLQRSGWCGTSVRITSSGTPRTYLSIPATSAPSHALALLAPLVKATTPTPSSGATDSWELKPGTNPSCSTTR